MGAGTLDMRGGALQVVGPAQHSLDTRAERFGYAGAHAASVRAREVALDKPLTKAGDGAIDWSAAPSGVARGAR